MWYECKHVGHWRWKLNHSRNNCGRKKTNSVRNQRKKKKIHQLFALSEARRQTETTSLHKVRSFVDMERDEISWFLLYFEGFSNSLAHFLSIYAAIFRLLIRLSYFIFLIYESSKCRFHVIVIVVAGFIDAVRKHCYCAELLLLLFICVLYCIAYDIYVRTYVCMPIYSFLFFSHLPFYLWLNVNESFSYIFSVCVCMLMCVLLFE